MHVSMYVLCMYYARMYICLYTCMYVLFTYIHMYVFMCVCVYACTYVCTYVLRTYICMYVFMCLCTYACLFVCLFVYLCNTDGIFTLNIRQANSLDLSSTTNARTFTLYFNVGFIKAYLQSMFLAFTKEAQQNEN